MENFIDFAMMKIIGPFCILTILLIILSLPFIAYSCYKQSQSPTFSLYKNEWSCTLTHDYTTTSMVLVGKIMVPQIINHHDCVQYTHL